jgi:hypothetical protein
VKEKRRKFERKKVKFKLQGKKMQKCRIKGKGCIRSKYWHLVKGVKYKILFWGRGIWVSDRYLDPCRAGCGWTRL